MVKFWDLLKRVNKNSGSTSSTKYENTTKEFISYETIKFRTYYDIASTGDYTMLQTKGRIDVEKCIEVWEDIVRLNDEATGSSRYAKIFKQHKKYARLLHEYLYVKTALCYLYTHGDSKLVEDLRTKGYFINRKNIKLYDESIVKCFTKANSILTKISMQSTEIQKSIPAQTKRLTFEELMAHLISNLGFVVSDDITLARYNEYWKLIKAKNQPQNEPNKNERRVRSR